MLFSCAFSIFAQDMNVARAVARVESVNFCRISFRFLLTEKWKKNIFVYMPPESARAVAEGLPVGRIDRISFGFLLAEKVETNRSILPTGKPSLPLGRSLGVFYYQYIFFPLSANVAFQTKIRQDRFNPRYGLGGNIYLMQR